MGGDTGLHRRSALRRAGIALVGTGAIAIGAAAAILTTGASTSAAVGRSRSVVVADGHPAEGPASPARPQAAASSAVHGSADSTVPVWSDEFDGPAGTRPDPRRWMSETGGSGWGNQELECNTDAADTSALDGHGHLVLTARRDPGTHCADGSTNDYTSARLSTANLATLRYGKLRVRAQLPSSSGLWPGIWALGADHDTVGWPQSGEIDVAEVVGKTPNTIYQTLHGPTPTGAPYSLGTQYSIGRSTGSGFHTYGVDWTPSRISFSVDGDVYVDYTRAQVEQHGTWAFDQPFYLLLDLAVGGTFPGSPDAATSFPAQMLVDFVRVYR